MRSDREDPPWGDFECPLMRLTAVESMSFRQKEDLFAQVDVVIGVDVSRDNLPVLFYGLERVERINKLKDQQDVRILAIEYDQTAPFDVDRLCGLCKSFKGSYDYEAGHVGLRPGEHN